jgi:hypothetical protein
MHAPVICFDLPFRYLHIDFTQYLWFPHFKAAFDPYLRQEKLR